MKDIHNHLLYNIDDGSESIEESISLLEELEKSGITHIMLTPHFNRKYQTNNKEKIKLLKLLQKKTKIKLYLGNEIRLDNHIIENINNNNIYSLNNSKYLLVEFHLFEKQPFTYELLHKLISNGYIPIIAHIERYDYLNNDDIKEYLNMGCLLQSNLTSIDGFYGRKAKKRIKYLLKNNMIFVLGTDYHHKIDLNIEKCLRKVEKITENNQFNAITNKNFDKIINDETL